jgi:hypothetical protein
MQAGAVKCESGQHGARSRAAEAGRGGGGAARAHGSDDRRDSALDEDKAAGWLHLDPQRADGSVRCSAALYAL